MAKVKPSSVKPTSSGSGTRAGLGTKNTKQIIQHLSDSESSDSSQEEEEQHDDTPNENDDEAPEVIETQEARSGREPEEEEEEGNVEEGEGGAMEEEEDEELTDLGKAVGRAVSDSNPRTRSSGGSGTRRGGGSSGGDVGKGKGKGRARASRSPTVNGIDKGKGKGRAKPKLAAKTVAKRVSALTAVKNSTPTSILKQKRSSANSAQRLAVPSTSTTGPASSTSSSNITSVVPESNLDSVPPSSRRGRVSFAEEHDIAPTPEPIDEDRDVSASPGRARSSRSAATAASASISALAKKTAKGWQIEVESETGEQSHSTQKKSIFSRGQENENSKRKSIVPQYSSSSSSSSENEDVPQASNPSRTRAQQRKARGPSTSDSDTDVPKSKMSGSQARARAKPKPRARKSVVVSNGQGKRKGKQPAKGLKPVGQAKAKVLGKGRRKSDDRPGRKGKARATPESLSSSTTSSRSHSNSPSNSDSESDRRPNVSHSDRDTKSDRPMGKDARVADKRTGARPKTDSNNEENSTSESSSTQAVMTQLTKGKNLGKKSTATRSAAVKAKARGSAVEISDGSEDQDELKRDEERRSGPLVEQNGLPSEMNEIEEDELVEEDVMMVGDDAEELEMDDIVTVAEFDSWGKSYLRVGIPDSTRPNKPIYVWRGANWFVQPPGEVISENKGKGKQPLRGGRYRRQETAYWLAKVVDIRSPPSAVVHDDETGKGRFQSLQMVYLKVQWYFLERDEVYFPRPAWSELGGRLAGMELVKTEMEDVISDKSLAGPADIFYFDDKHSLIKYDSIAIVPEVRRGRKRQIAEENCFEGNVTRIGMDQDTYFFRMTLKKESAEKVLGKGKGKNKGKAKTSSENEPGLTVMEPPRLATHCICRSRYLPWKPQIFCPDCQVWYHLSCIVDASVSLADDDGLPRFSLTEPLYGGAGDPVDGQEEADDEEEQPDNVVGKKRKRTTSRSDPPSKKKKASTGGNYKEVDPFSSHLIKSAPDVITLAARESIVRGGRYGLLGNINMVSQAREMLTQLYSGERDLSSIKHGWRQEIDFSDTKWMLTNMKKELDELADEDFVERGRGTGKQGDGGGGEKKQKNGRAAKANGKEKDKKLDDGLDELPDGKMIHCLKCSRKL